jgi:hypothetical protein
MKIDTSSIPLVFPVPKVILMEGVRGTKGVSRNGIAETFPIMYHQGFYLNSCFSALR